VIIEVTKNGTTVRIDDSNAKEPASVKWSDERESIIKVLEAIFEQLNKEK